MRIRSEFLEIKEVLVFKKIMDVVGRMGHALQLIFVE
jgi:hypothetical protein